MSKSKLLVRQNPQLIDVFLNYFGYYRSVLLNKLSVISWFRKQLNLRVFSPCRTIAMAFFVTLRTSIFRCGEGDSEGVGLGDLFRSCFSLSRTVSTHLVCQNYLRCLHFVKMVSRSSNALLSRSFPNC